MHQLLLPDWSTFYLYCCLLQYCVFSSTVSFLDCEDGCAVCTVNSCLTCTDTSHKITTERTCVPSDDVCSDNCAVCSAEDMCSVCEAGYFLDSNACADSKYS